MTCGPSLCVCGHLAQEAEGGSWGRILLFANCDFLPSAALPEVRGQKKSPPPYDTLPKGETDTNQTAI